MPLTVIGVSHRTAPIEVRERFAFAPEAGDAFLSELLDTGVAEEALLVSTCNRTELYLSLPGPVGCPAIAVSALARHAGYTRQEAQTFFFRHSRREAVEHLFRVVASLDSMVLGDAQIQGQIRSAYVRASSLDGAQSVGPVLSRLFQGALHLGGRVRSETTLGVGAASVASAGIELARKVFGSLQGRSVLLVGAGEMGRLSLDCLHAAGVGSLVIANRSEERARTLAERVNGRVAPMKRLADELRAADVVVAATSAARPILSRELVEGALAGRVHRPLLLLDLGVPRNVEPAVGELHGAFLYTTDDVQRVVESSLEQRQAAVPQAERLVQEEVEEFWKWYLSRQVVPLIRNLRDRAEEMRRAESERALRRLQHLPAEDRAAVEELTHRLLNKMLHAPTVRLRAAGAAGTARGVVEAARYLFELEEAV
jgi:glutamyl-tRNA reductase